MSPFLFDENSIKILNNLIFIDGLSSHLFISLTNHIFVINIAI